MKKGTIIGIVSGVVVLGASAYVFRDKLYAILLKIKDGKEGSQDVVTLPNPENKTVPPQTKPKPAETPITPTSNIGILNSNTIVRQYPTWNSAGVKIEIKVDGIVKTTTAISKSSSVKILESVTGFYKVMLKSNGKEYTGYIGKQFIDRF